MGPALTASSIVMNNLAYEFSPAERRVLDRYTRLLGSLLPILDNVSMVFERRRMSGHEPTWIATDPRLNQVIFHERYLKALWERIESIRNPTRILVGELAIFTRESLELTARTSRSQSIDQVDVRAFSLSRSTIWGTFPPRSVRQLVDGLGGLFLVLGGHYDPMKFMLLGIYELSFGFNSIFTQAMNFPSCKCHQQQSAGQEIFRSMATTPVWDITYSSADPVIRSREYQNDVTRLFKDFSSLSIQISVFVEEMKRRTDNAKIELWDTTNMSTMGKLNFKLESVLESVEELLRMLDHFEAWLRK